MEKRQDELERKHGIYFDFDFENMCSKDGKTLSSNNHCIVPDNIIKNIVDEIINKEIKDRCGLSDVWENILDDTKQEIESGIFNIIKRNLESVSI